MASELYHEIVSQRGSFERLIARLPGFKGYHEKNARREADDLLRAHLATELQALVDRFARIERRILDNSGIAFMSRTREIRTKMQAYVDRVKSEMPGYSGMWATIKVTEDDLDRLYAFDEAQFRYEMKLDTEITKLEDLVKGGGNEDFTDQLYAIQDATQEAIDAFKLREDVILQLGETY